jgi:hypothetical protein
VYYKFKDNDLLGNTATMVSSACQEERDQEPRGKTGKVTTVDGKNTDQSLSTKRETTPKPKW